MRSDLEKMKRERDLAFLVSRPRAKFTRFFDFLFLWISSSKAPGAVCFGVVCAKHHHRAVRVKRRARALDRSIDRSIRCYLSFIVVFLFVRGSRRLTSLSLSFSSFTMT